MCGVPNARSVDGGVWCAAPRKFFEKKRRFGGPESNSSNENVDKTDAKMFMKNNLGTLYRPSIIIKLDTVYKVLCKLQSNCKLTNDN